MRTLADDGVPRNCLNGSGSYWSWSVGWSSGLRRTGSAAPTHGEDGPPRAVESPPLGPALAKATDWAAVTAWAAWATVAVYVLFGVFAWIQVLQARRVREE
jgi:hypothetical protein